MFSNFKVIVYDLFFFTFEDEDVIFFNNFVENDLNFVFFVLLRKMLSVFNFCWFSLVITMRRNFGPCF